MAIEKYKSKTSTELRGLLDKRDRKISNLDAELSDVYGSFAVQRGTRMATTSMASFLAGLLYAKKPGLQNFGGTGVGLDHVIGLAGAVTSFLFAGDDSLADTPAPDIAEGVANAGLVPSFKGFGRKLGGQIAA